MRRYRVGEEVLVNTAPIVGGRIRTDDWVEATVMDRSNDTPPRYWVATDHGSPLWVSDHFIKEMPKWQSRT